MSIPVTDQDILHVANFGLDLAFGTLVHKRDSIRVWIVVGILPFEGYYLRALDNYEEQSYADDGDLCLATVDTAIDVRLDNGTQNPFDTDCLPCYTEPWMEK